MEAAGEVREGANLGSHDVFGHGSRSRRCPEEVEDVDTVLELGWYPGMRRLMQVSDRPGTLTGPASQAE